MDIHTPGSRFILTSLLQKSPPPWPVSSPVTLEPNYPGQRGRSTVTVQGGGPHHVLM